MSEQKYICVNTADELIKTVIRTEDMVNQEYVFRRVFDGVKFYTPAEIMAQQWVPVTERLPEDGEICLLYKAGFGIGLFQYQTDGAFFADKDAHQFDRDSGGVFWQHLPQPPKSNVQ